jgi:hypothetical protein
VEIFCPRLTGSFHREPPNRRHGASHRRREQGRRGKAVPIRTASMRLSTPRRAPPVAFHRGRSGPAALQPAARRCPISFGPDPWTRLEGRARRPLASWEVRFGASRKLAKRPSRRSREGVMKCSNPDCGYGIGLVSHRRSWFDKQRYCSKRCLDAVTSQVTERRSSHQRLPVSYFEWLLSQPTRRPSRGRVSLVSVSRPRSGDEAKAQLKDHVRLRPSGAVLQSVLKCGR